MEKGLVHVWRAKGMGLGCRDKACVHVWIRKSMGLGIEEGDGPAFGILRLRA